MTPASSADLELLSSDPAPAVDSAVPASVAVPAAPQSAAPHPSADADAAAAGVPPSSADASPLTGNSPSSAAPPASAGSSAYGAAPASTGASAPPISPAVVAASPESSSAASAADSPADPLAPFAAALSADAGLQQALARHPELQPAIESALRQSAEFGEWRQLFPSLDSARYAADQSATLAGFDRLYYSNQPEAARELLERLYHNQFLRDPESGELMLDAAGQPVSTGAYDRLAAVWRDSLIEALHHQAGDHQDAELASALETLRSRLSPSAAPDFVASPHSASAATEPSAAPAGASQTSAGASASASAASLPPGIRARLERLDSLERQLESGEREQWRAWHDGLAQEVSSTVRADIEQALASAALPAYVKSKVIDDVLEGVNRRAAADPAYQHRIQTLLRAAQAQGYARPETRTRILSAARAQARGQLTPIAQQVLQQALAGLRQEQQQRLARVEQQRSRVEIKGAGAAPAPVRRADHDRIRGAEKTLGRRLTDREILDL